MFLVMAQRAVSEGQYRKALQSLSSAPTVQQSCLPSTHLSLPDDVSPPPIQFSSEEVVRALKSYPSGSAPGPYGLRANYLKQAVFCPSPDREVRPCPASPVLLTCSVLVKYLAASPPISVDPSFYPAKRSLEAIAVGEVLRWLTFKCTARAAQCEVLDILAPQQLGVGISCGCEAVVHSFSNCLEDPNNPPEDSSPFRKVRHTLPPFQLGWNAAIGCNQFYV